MSLLRWQVLHDPEAEAKGVQILQKERGKAMSRYIDVDALGIGRANPDVFIREEYARGWNLAIEIIENAPTADVVEVRHGKWNVTKKRAPNGRRILYEIKTCSVCGKTHGRHNPNYCPNCGARMDGET